MISLADTGEQTEGESFPSRAEGWLGGGSTAAGTAAGRATQWEAAGVPDCVHHTGLLSGGAAQRGGQPREEVLTLAQHPAGLSEVQGRAAEVWLEAQWRGRW